MWASAYPSIGIRHILAWESLLGVDGDKHTQCLHRTNLKNAGPGSCFRCLPINVFAGDTQKPVEELNPATAQGQQGTESSCYTEALSVRGSEEQTTRTSAWQGHTSMHLQPWTIIIWFLVISFYEGFFVSFWFWPNGKLREGRTEKAHLSIAAVKSVCRVVYLMGLIRSCSDISGRRGWFTLGEDVPYNSSQMRSVYLLWESLEFLRNEPIAVKEQASRIWFVNS